MKIATDRASKLSSQGIDIVSVTRSTWTGIKPDAVRACGQKGKFYHYFPLTTKLEYFRRGVAGDGKTWIVYCSKERLVVDPLYGSNPMHTDTGYWYGYRENPLRLTNYKFSVAESNTNNQIKSPEESRQLLTNIKNTCMEFGYKVGTETLANCMKDLYLKQTQIQSKSTSMTTAKPKRKIDPSVWEDLENLSKDLLSGKSVSESLGGVSSNSSSSKIQCFKTNERVSGTNKICSYNCMGSEVVQNVSSTSICPLSIDLN